MFKKERRSWIILICVIMVPVFCFVIAPLLIYGIGHFWSSTEKVYEVNWNITLPDDMDLLDDRKTESFRGDGVRHTVYSVHGKADYFQDFRTSGSAEIEKVCFDVLADLQVEEPYIPDFKMGYVWKKYTKYSDFLIVLYIPDKSELHLFQQFI